MRAPQVTDQPLVEWVNNTDYDESFACDLLEYSPRVVSKWLARSAFYPTLYWTVLKSNISHSTNAWMSEIDDNIILGALPRGKAQQLWEMGVGLVINTCEEWDGNRDEYKTMGIDQVILETIDYTSPQLKDAERAVQAIQLFLADNPKGKVYIHCKAGRGRSVTILLCWYISKGFSPLQAQRLLSDKRPQVSSRCWKRRVIKEYVKVHVLGQSLNNEKTKNE